MLPLEIDIDAMSSLRSRLIMLQETLETGDFESIGGGMREFGGFDRTPLLEHHHGLAHGLMLETIKSIVASIDVFYTNLVSIQDSVAEQDMNAQVQMQAYLAALENLTASSYLPGLEETRERYRDNHGDA
jgi:hypothetical protein